MLELSIDTAMMFVEVAWSVVVGLGIIVLMVIVPLTLLYHLIPSLIAAIIGRFMGDK